VTKPWEKYGASAPAEAGPWARYGGSTAPQEPSLLDKAKRLGADAVDAVATMPSIGEAIPLVGPLVRKAAHATSGALGMLRGEDPLSEYSKAEAEAERRDADYAEKHPIAAGVRGGLAAAVVPAPNFTAIKPLAEGAGALAKGLVGTANAGARVGANAAISAADAAVQGKDAGDAAQTTGIVSAALEAAGPLGRLVGKAPAAARGFAERKAFKAAAGTQEKAYEAAGDRVNQIGRDMLDEGVVTFGSTPRTIAKRAKKAKKAAWGEMDDLYSRVDASGPPSVSGRGIADRLRALAKELDSPQNEAVVDRLLKQADRYEAMGMLPLTEAQRLKNQYKWNPKEPTSLSLGEEATNKAKLAIGSEMEEAVGRATARAQVPRATASEAVPQTGSGPVSRHTFPPSKQAPQPILKDAEAVAEATPTEAFRDLNRRYGSMASAEKAGKTLARRLEKNRGPFSATDYWTASGMGGPASILAMLGGSGIGEAAVVGGAASLAAAIANKVARERGNSMLATSFDRLSKLMERPAPAFTRYAETLERAAQRGPAALATAHALLMERDPAYRELVEGQPAPAAP